MRPDPVPVDPKSALEPPEVVTVDTHRVWCDGGVGALGHPRVYMEMGASGFVECPYCDRRFVLADPHGRGGHGAPHGEDEVADPSPYEGANASRV